jgi:hypothetical protein
MDNKGIELLGSYWTLAGDVEPVIPGLKGRPPSPAGSGQGPMPLTLTVASGPSA